MRCSVGQRMRLSSLTRFGAAVNGRLAIIVVQVTCIMSEQETVRERDHAQGTSNLTPEFVSHAIKEAFGSFKEYFDSSIEKVKEDSDKKILAASTELQQLKRASELSFRFKGNKVQFEFNSNLQEKLEKGVASLEEGKIVPALSMFKEGIADLKKRKKLIRLADKSDAGECS